MFPIISGIRCVCIRYETISLVSTALIMSAFLICKSSLSTIDSSVEYALRDFDVVSVVVVVSEEMIIENIFITCIFSHS